MTNDDLMAALLALVPPAERDAINTVDTLPVYQAVTHSLAQQSARRIRQAQASYMLPHSAQEGIPASFGAPTFLTLTLDRKGSIDIALRIDPGKMTVVGPSGRLYVNSKTIAYARRDESSIREAEFVCTVLGECGNLDFLVNPDINEAKGLPAGWFRAEHMQFADQSRGRSNSGATLLQSGGSTAIKDSGRPSTFEATDEGLYVEIIDSAQPTAVGRLLRIRKHEWPGIEEPPASNIRPTLALLDDFEVRERWVAVLQDDGGVFTSYAVEANDLAELDVPLTPLVAADDDAIYFASPYPITALEVRIDQPGEGTWDTAWEIWDGVAWVVPATIIDGTGSFRASGQVRVDVGSVPLQVQTTVNALGPYYWVRARVTNWVETKTQPIAGYAFPLTYQPIAAEAGTVEWAVRDWKDLGFTITTAVHGQLGRDDDLYLIGDGRNLYPELGETAEHFRNRISKVPDVVSPAALTRVVNRILASLQYTCRIVDTGNLYLGFFFDEDAYDYYEDPADPFPTNPRRRLLSIWEAYGFFWVELPVVAQGDFGIFFDDGPTMFDAAKGIYLGPAFDGGFVDGVPFAGMQNLYKTIFTELRRRKGGGVDFALVPDESLNVLP